MKNADCPPLANRLACPSRRPQPYFPQVSAAKRPEDGRSLATRIHYACCSLRLGSKRISTRFSNAAAMRRSMSKEWPS